MSRGTVNKVILIGRLGNDPDIRSTASGMTMANISLATNFPTKDRQTGEWKEETEWTRVVFFDRVADVVKQYLKKGSLIYVEGRLQTRKWQDQNGQDRYTTEVVANNMEMLGGRDDHASQNQSYSQPSYAAPSAPVAPAPAKPLAPPLDKNFDEDVPF